MWARPRIEVIYVGSGGRPRSFFSREEVRHLLIAFVGLVAMFGLSDLLYPPSFASGWTFPERALFFIPLAAAVVGTAFLLHEMSHKFVARRYRCWAEFRSAPLWIGIGIVMAVVLRGFFLAAPGAVVSAGATTKRENGIISGAGPAMNMALVLALLPAYLFLGPLVSFEFWYALRSLVFLNVWLGLFNMLPISLGLPLDGVKVLDWDPRVFIAMIVPFGALAALFFAGMI